MPYFLKSQLMKKLILMKNAKIIHFSDYIFLFAVFKKIVSIFLLNYFKV